MEIKKLDQNKIRCALSEEEIEDMGYEIDEIIANTEVTQEFMRDVVELMEEEGNISMENISPVVQAELLQDHSLAITFGGESEVDLKSLVDIVGQIVGQISPEKRKQLKNMLPKEQEDTVEEIFHKFGKTNGLTKTETKDEKKTQSFRQKEEELFEKTVVFSMEFDSISEAVDLVKAVPFGEKMPKSSFYKCRDKYYMMMDFISFTKDELRPLAFTIVEYNEKRSAQASRVAFIREHGICIVENEALETLMQL